MSTDPVFVGLGSNQGDRIRLIHRAVDQLSAHEHVRRIERSSLIETDPVGVDHDRSFMNGVLRCRIDLDPLVLLDTLMAIENRLGRVSRGSGRPRRIDLDLLFYGRRIVDLERLTVPHPRAHKRRFVLEPMVELAPGFEHPVLEKSMTELLHSLER